MNPPKYNLRERIYENSDKSISIYKVKKKYYYFI